MTTICPALRLGARTCSSVVLKGGGVGRSDPGISAAPMPSRERAAIRVVFLPRLRGTVPLARSPDDALAHTGTSRQCWTRIRQEKPDLLSEACSYSLAMQLALLPCALSPPMTFFSRPTQPFDGTTHCLSAHAYTVHLFPHTTVLRKRWRRHLPVVGAAHSPPPVPVSLANDQEWLWAAHVPPLAVA